MSSKAAATFRAPEPQDGTAKATGIRWLNSLFGAQKRSEPFAAVAAVPVQPAVTSHAALHPAMPPAFATVSVAGQDGKTALLAIVERLVERIGGVRDLLHGGGRGGHVVSARS